MKTDYQSIIKQSMYSAKLSRLLAEENIGIEFSDSASTASFDPMNRILTFPYNTVMMDSDIHELFMFHEVSHALHLPVNAIKLVRDSGADPDMFNIVIDIRDERLIKERFPGAVKPMQAGYTKLLENGFFGKSPEVSINMQAFPSRLNAYAKLGIVTGSFVKLNTKEVQFYNKCYAATTLEECIELAKELGWMQHQYLMSLSDMAKDADIAEFIDGEMDDESEEMTEEERKQAIEELRQQRTDLIFENNMRGTQLRNASVYQYGDYTELQKNATIISTKDYFKYLTETREFEYTETTTTIRELRANIQTSVDSMVRVFESRKAAARRANARVSETGQIDISRVYRYKFDDKIFGSEMVIPDAKNHGYVILVDMSGSMNNIMKDVIQQIAVMVEFFRRINVKYKIIGFGMGIASSLDSNRRSRHELLAPSYSTGLPIRYRGDECLFEFLNSEQSLKEHNMCLYGIMTTRGYSLGGTPTGSAIINVEYIAQKFFNTNRIQKRHLIVMTDGEPTDTIGNSQYTSTTILTDKVTQQTVISSSNTPYNFIDMIGSVFRARHNIELTTISIAKTLRTQVTSMFTNSRIEDSKDFTSKGFVKVVNHSTKNPVYFVKPFDVETDVSNFDISEAKTPAQLSRQMLKSMKSVKKSRSFLNAIAEQLS